MYSFFIRKCIWNLIFGKYGMTKSKDSAKAFSQLFVRLILYPKLIPKTSTSNIKVIGETNYARTSLLREAYNGILHLS